MSKYIIENYTVFTSSKGVQFIALNSGYWFKFFSSQPDFTPSKPTY